MLHTHKLHTHATYTYATHTPPTHSHTCYIHTCHTHATHTCYTHTTHTPHTLSHMLHAHTCCTHMPHIHMHATHTRCTHTAHTPHAVHTLMLHTHMHALAGASFSPFFFHSALSQIYMGINKTKNKAKIACWGGAGPLNGICGLLAVFCSPRPISQSQLLGARSLEQTQGQALGTGTCPDSSVGPGWPCLQSSKSQRNEYAKLRPTSH